MNNPALILIRALVLLLDLYIPLDQRPAWFVALSAAHDLTPEDVNAALERIHG